MWLAIFISTCVGVDGYLFIDPLSKNLQKEQGGYKKGVSDLYTQQGWGGEARAI
jgi:hypothetical protein